MGFKGGYYFKHFEGAAEPVLRECTVPRTVSVPAICASFSFTPLVETGDVVKAGRVCLSTDDEYPVTLVSPVNGTVTEVSEEGVTIASDGTSAFFSVEGHTRAPWHLDREAAFALFRSTGSALLCDVNFASISELDEVEHIIVNAVHNAPLNQAWIPVMTGDSTVFSNGLRTLKRLFPDAQVSIAVNKRNRKFFETLQIDTPEVYTRSSVKVLSDRYPQEHPELITRDVLGRKLFSPEGVRDRSVLVQGFFDVIQIGEIMTLGRPFMDRILTIAGPGVSKPGWYRVRIGTTLEELGRQLFKSDDRGPWRIIRGNLFEGEGIASVSSVIHPSDTEISVLREPAQRELLRFMRPGFAWDSYSKTSVSGIIPLLPRQLDSSVHGGVRPCVQCNYCDEVCPVAIYPFLIWKYVQAEKTVESFRFRPHECIGCGLCDYVCPSKIDIMSSVIQAKDAYREVKGADDEID